MKFLAIYIRLVRQALVASTVMVLTCNAFGDELQDAKMLLKEGKLSEALQVADKGLEKRKADPSMLFVKGLILSEQKRNAEAIEVFSRITAEHPDYPEPYNNLAVLFATEGQYPKARLALETALKLNPRYFTAQENLGDVFLQSAVQAYSEAAKLDGDNSALKSKIRNVRQTLGMPANDPSTINSTAQGKLVGGPSAKLTSSSSAASEGEGIAERERVLRVVDRWAKAWSSKNTDAYFSLYADDFKTPGGQSLREWQKTRLARISRKDQIDIQVLSPSVTIEDNIAVVNFRQVYVAGKTASNARKVLTLKNHAGDWKILQEKSEG